MGLFSSAPTALAPDLERVVQLPDRPEGLRKDYMRRIPRHWSTLDQSVRRDVRLILCSGLNEIVYVDSGGVMLADGEWKGYYKFECIRGCSARQLRTGNWAVDFDTLIASHIWVEFRTQVEAARLVEVVHGI